MNYIPVPEAWGREGWSYCSEEAARQKFDQLVSRDARSPELLHTVREGRVRTLRVGSS
ncbi:MAG: hypothetical protein HY735_22005 [Verrucomicrobia bacterium]|nr:hypothetical protein [Verrucomicrobiota bacterium]